MPRRRETGARDQLSPEELARLRSELAALPLYELETYYRASYTACQYSTRLPSPRLIQELVQAWRELRKRPPVRVG